VHKLLLILLGIILISTSVKAQIELADPQFNNQIELCYEIFETKKDLTFNYYVYIDEITTTYGSRYSITSLRPGTSKEAEIRAQTLYTADPFCPILFTYSSDNPEKNHHYYKEINWDWKNQITSFVEISQIRDEYKREQHETQWKKEPSFDLSLIYNGLINGLPLNDYEQTSKLRFSIKQFSADVIFKIVTEEAITAAGQDWECYKIVAYPDLGPLLNWIKLFLGDTTTYIWITKTKPRLIIKTQTKTPWLQGEIILKDIKTKGDSLMQGGSK